MSLLNMHHQEQVVATLSLVHDVVPASEAIRLIQQGRREGIPPLQAMLQQHGEVVDKTLTAIADELGYFYHDMATTGQAFKIDAELLEKVDMAKLRELCALPMAASEAGVVVVAAGDPTEPRLRDYLYRVYTQEQGLQVKYVAAHPAYVLRELQTLLTRLQSEEISEQAVVQGSQTTGDEINLLDVEEVTSPVVMWVSSMLETAFLRRASDIHLDPNTDGSYTTFYRIDGVRQPEGAPPRHREMEVVSQIMHRSGMDPTTLRKPQDGRLSFVANQNTIDGRVSVIPTVNGPKVTIRILDKRALSLHLEDMGFSANNLRIFRKHSHRSQGAIVVSGPTGSGKSTTLYALLREIASPEKNTLTIEQPVEYKLHGINQMQAVPIEHAHRGTTFQEALRSMLRADPDVILVGEIRDVETAQVALDASITGHLVFSTVHAPDAASVYTRLIEIGMPAYAVAEALSVTTAQRLMRRLCTCSVEEEPTDTEARLLDTLGLDLPSVWHTRGCALCNGIGYRGRLAVAEAMENTPLVRDMTMKRAPASAIQAAAQEEGFVPLRDEAIRHVLDGITTISEFVRIADLTDVM